VKAADGAVAWRQSLGPGQVSTPAYRDGVVYVASGLDETAAHHMLTAFRASDGVRQWTFAAPSGAALYVAAIGPDLAYVVGLDGSINALSDGAVRWTRQTSGAIGSVATLSQNLLYVSVSDGTIEALDADTGQLRWTVR